MRVLAIVHEHNAGPGVFAEEIEARGGTLDHWSVPEDAEPPGELGGYDAVMVFGGAMNPDQEDGHPWLGPEKAVLAQVIKAGKPVLGACLGAELVCEAAGGSTRRMADPEIGWIEVEVAPEGTADPVVGALAPRFTGFEWHSYECVPPEGAVELARTPACVQAFRIGDRVWGIQFHAEVSAADAGSWLDEWDKDEDAVRIGLDVEGLRAETTAAIGAWNDDGRALCGRFLDQVRSNSQ